MVFFCGKCEKCFAGSYIDWFRHADGHKIDDLTDLELAIKEFLLKIGDPLDWLDPENTGPERYKKMTKEELIKEIKKFKNLYLFDDEFRLKSISNGFLLNKFKKMLMDLGYIWIDDYEDICRECENWCDCEITPHPPDEDDCV